MNFFNKEKRDNLIKDSIKTAKDELSDYISPLLTTAVAVMIFIMAVRDGKREPQSIVVNVYTTKEVM